MKKVILCAIVTMLFIITQLVNAQDNFINDGDVKVEEKEDFFEIYAEGIGQGLTLESAKIEAMNSFMPQLVAKTKNLSGSISTFWTTNEETKGEGGSKIDARIVVQDYWELEDGIYTCQIKFIITNME